MNVFYGFETRREAEHFIDKLEYIIDTYGVVTVADANDLVDVISKYTDNKYGWVSMRGIHVTHNAPHSYLVNFPDPMDIREESDGRSSCHEYSLSASRILESIKHMGISNDDYTIVILGRCGPTGKSWLCNALINKGYRAFDIAEDINSVVDYGGDSNHIHVNENKKLITIILNKFISLRRDVK